MTTPHALPRQKQLASDAESLCHAVAERLKYTVGKDDINATKRDWLYSLCYAVRDRMIERWMETHRGYYRADAKRVYYLSLEFLIGRTLLNSLLNLEMNEAARSALQSIGLDLEELREQEFEAALGNGGLGRLAACFLDAMATLGVAGTGYGLRYDYGMFHQSIRDGVQVETSDYWLRYGNPWEFQRPEILYPVNFHGRVIHFRDAHDRDRAEWVDADEVLAMAYDTPVPGFQTRTVNNLRLWSAKATREFELDRFNKGEYVEAVQARTHSENLTRVLYPDDSTENGRVLRLKQEYFFASASLQDILFRFHKIHADFALLPERVAIQLNDTHPAIAIPEMMRLLLDRHGLAWDVAWDLTRRTFSYTNHTLMPEALETWPVALVGHVLPRHLEIIYEINRRFLDEVRERFPDDEAMPTRLSLIDESGGRRVRMAHLAVVGSHRVNGVSALHTELMRRSIFADFHRVDPNRIVNITNGITPRRWLNQENPELAAVLTRRIGPGWVRHLEGLESIRPLHGDAGFQADIRRAKQANKCELANRIQGDFGIDVDPESLFDVQVKRIHEYKRQLLNLLYVVTRLNRLRDGMDLPSRTVIFAGKAAPGYARAKAIIRLIHGVADVVNHDPAVRGRLRVVFMPDYNVTVAGRIIRAADLSEQISTAGTEASGTGNMKLALNGALTLGTLDGANIEIRECVGEANFFLFGLTTEEAARVRSSGYDPRTFWTGNTELARALDMIERGDFSPGEPDRYRGLIQDLRYHDPYLLCADFASYQGAQESVDQLFANPAEWDSRVIQNIAGMGHFSADRTIRQYANEIWRVPTAVTPTESRPKVATGTPAAEAKSSRSSRSSRSGLRPRHRRPRAA